MTENEKIELVIEEYKEYLNNSNSDICHSIKGVWFIYLYDDVHDIYECFYEFHTADELRKIIVGEIIDNVNIAIESTAEEIVSANIKKLKMIDVDKIPENYDLQGIINDFMVNVNAIKKTMNLIENACKGVQCLDEENRKADTQV